MRPLILILGVTLTVACMSCGDSTVAVQSSAPAAADWRAAARAAASTVDSSWLAARLAVLADDDMQGRDNLSPGGAKARQWLEEQMTAIGLEPMGTDGFEQAFDQGVNLVGRIAGKDPALAHEYVLISGHYDHLGVVGAPHSQCHPSNLAPGDDICNGAADNAAGSIATLAVANALMHSQGTRRSILVVLWDAEEDGLLGSHYFADTDPRVPLDRIAAMYSIDNVGAYIIKGVDDSFAIGTEYATGLREKVTAINTEVGFNQFPVSSFFVGSETGGRSDHLPFRLHNVPIIFFGSGSPPEYHTPADEIGIVGFDKLAKITRHIVLMTADVANDDTRPTFVAAPAPQLDDARALVALGKVVLADPASIGFDDPFVINLLEGWLTQLNAYLADPPQTDQEWAAYQRYVKNIITTVYQFIDG